MRVEQKRRGSYSAAGHSYQILILILLILPFSGSESYNFVTRFSPSPGSGGSYTSEDRGKPTFRNEARIYKEEVGTTALLLCKVNNLGDSIIVWKQKDRIISAGMGMIRKDKRLSLIGHVDGINLEIKDLRRDDAGNYICEVENSGEPILQTNKLEVLVPPKISSSHTGNTLTVRRDSSLTLSCNASGFPLPKITWQRQHQMLPNGEKEVSGTSLRFGAVHRSASGTYICTADNGVGAPVSATIKLNVIYSPEVNVDRKWVHGGVGHQAQISCRAFGSPEPQVRWYRETMLLDRNENRLMEQYGQRHNLVIANVQKEDFGNYSCSAENELGKARGFILLSGEPNRPLILSSSQGLFSDKYNLSWSVESFAPIAGYKIIYSKYTTNSGSEVRSRWHDVFPDISIHPLHQDKYPNSYENSYLFFALEPNTKYQVMIQARNEHGWGEYSEEFIFTTTSAANVPKELPVESHEPEKESTENIQKLQVSGLEDVTTSSTASPGVKTTYIIMILLALARTLLV